MLIIGFQDVYQDISIDAVQEILKFIRSGKSVIFAHDTTSYINTDHKKYTTRSQGTVTIQMEQ